MKEEKKEKLQKQISVLAAILKLLVLLIIIIGIPLYIYFFKRDWIHSLDDMQQIMDFFQQHKTESAFIYIGFQVVQIIISIIPGQQLQLAAGYLFGFWLGFSFSLIGAFIGTFCTYYLARLLGHDALHLFFGEEKVNSLIKRLNSKRGVMAVFIMYLIPGFPKDICGYAAGLSEMKAKAFLIISLIGRCPGMMGSLLIGKQLEEGNYTGAIIIAAIAVVLCFAGIIMRKRLTLWLDHAYEKLYR